jgi:hypothetical protein
LLSPVNPKTDAKRYDRITIGAMLWLDDDNEPRRPFAHEAEMLCRARMYRRSDRDEFGSDSTGHAGNGNNGIVLQLDVNLFENVLRASALRLSRGKTVTHFSGSRCRQQKSPGPFQGASVQMMRSSAYARTSPEALAGFADFAPRLVFVILARACAGDFDWRQRVSPQNWASTRLNRMP